MKIVSTSDGSHTLYHAELDEHYHSVHGALRESQHVFIEAGLRCFKDGDCVNILEVGLGTGLNAFLTFLENRKIRYTAIEAFPLKQQVAAALNYPQQLNAEANSAAFEKIHSSDWNQPVILGSDVHFLKLHTTLQEFSTTETFHLIYFDAFAPTVQPELWTKEIFDKMFAALKPGGILVTYCAKGEVKRNMKAAGFKVEALQGPPGKREMTRAIKC